MVEQVAKYDGINENLINRYEQLKFSMQKLTIENKKMKTQLKEASPELSHGAAMLKQIRILDPK